MKNPKDNDLASRRKAAAEAKAALLQAHRAAQTSDDPARLARIEERRLAAAAKEERLAERARLKAEEQARAAEAARAEAAARAEKAARAEEAARAAAAAQVQAPIDRVSRALDEEAMKKAERDRRYANRKARKK